jgi:hypothetical protein
VYGKASIKGADVKTMAKKRFWLGMLAIVLALGFIGCGGGDDDGSTDPKKITVTGITGDFHTAMITVMNNADAAMGTGQISNGSVTVDLMTLSSATAWTGSGSYVVQMQLEGSKKGMYLYTDGKTLEQLGFTEGDVVSSQDLPKFIISSANSTIALNKFLYMGEIRSGSDD